MRPLMPVLARIILVATALQGINAHEEDACPPRPTATSTKTVIVGGMTTAPDAGSQKGAMTTVVVTRLHTVTRGSTGGDDDSGEGDFFGFGKKALDDPLNNSPSATTGQEVVEYEYVYTDANGETFVDDASVLYLPTAGPDDVKASSSGSSAEPTAGPTDVRGLSGGSFAVTEDDHDDTDMNMDVVAAGNATSSTAAAISVKNRQGAASPTQTGSEVAVPTSTEANNQASTSPSSDFPKVVAGQEYEDEMSYFKETNHGAKCSAPGGIYDSRGACGIINMPDLLANPRDRVSVPQYLWDQFLPAGGVITPTDRGICGRNLTFKSNDKEIKLMAADHMGENNFDMCLNIWEKFGYKEDKGVKPVKFILEPET